MSEARLLDQERKEVEGDLGQVCACSPFMDSYVRDNYECLTSDRGTMPWKKQESLISRSSRQMAL